MLKFFLPAFFALILSGCLNQADSVKVNINEAAINSGSADAVSRPNQSSTGANQTQPDIAGNTAPDGAAVGPMVASIPARLELPVLFAQQAPFGNWDAAHEEACEEASMIMAEKYFTKQKLDETIMEQELQKILAWESENGYAVDLTAEETVYILKQYYGLDARISREVTVDRIKYELAQGNLIIIPAAGRDLKNPNFKRPGPIYHMLVIKGYNGTQFITNDPGTRKGNGYRYAYNVLINAIHDWNHQLAEDGMTEAEMRQGEKVMIVVEK